MSEDHAFETREAAERFATAHVRNSRNGSDPEILTLLEETELVRRENVSRVVPPGASPVLIPHFRWVIKNEDLALMDAIFDGVRSAASAGFFVVTGIAQVSEWAAIAGLVAAIFKVCRNAVRNGKVLESDTYAVLSTVKAFGPISESAVFESLHSRDKKWTVHAVYSALVALKAMPMSSGEPKQLVTEDSAGEWRSAGL